MVLLQHKIQRDSTAELPLEVSESILHTASSTSLYIADKLIGVGTLYVTSAFVRFVSGNDSDDEVRIDYPAIILHAITRDTSTFPQPCIYCQCAVEAVHADSPDDTSADNNAESDGSGADEICVEEVRIAPNDTSFLEDIFAAMCRGAALNPDTHNATDDDDDDAFIYNDGAPPAVGDTFTLNDDTGIKRARMD